jgi:hypothetical protein
MKTRVIGVSFGALQPAPPRARQESQESGLQSHRVVASAGVKDVDILREPRDLPT